MKCTCKGYKRNQDILDAIQIESAFTDILIIERTRFAMSTDYGGNHQSDDEYRPTRKTKEKCQ
jgi:hypothetical protein